MVFNLVEIDNFNRLEIEAFRTEVIEKCLIYARYL